VLLALDGEQRLTGCGAITGWAIGRDSTIVAVEAWVDGRQVAATKPNQERPDVWQQFGWYRSKNPPGFRLCPPAGLLGDGRYEMLVRAFDERGNYHEIRSDLVVDRFTLQDDPELRVDLVGSNREYQLWLRDNDCYPLPHITHGPLISVIIPVYRPNLRYLQQAIASVREQAYPNWELCLCDDGSNDLALTQFLESLVREDKRFHLVSCEVNQGIAAATNRAMRPSHGEYVAFMDQDDRLHPQALQAIADAISSQPADLYFTDEDRLDDRGDRVEPFFKPGWSRDLLLSMMYLGHLCVYKRAWLNRIGWLGSHFDGTQDWELALRSTMHPDCRIVHVPGVFYHWRVGGHSASVAGNQLCHERGKQAVMEVLQRQRDGAIVEDGPRSCTFHVRHQMNSSPLVSILIPTRDRSDLLQRCLQSLRKRTNYQSLEIIVLDNGSRSGAAQRYLRRCPADKVLRYDGPFNHSWLNNEAAQQARGDLLLFLNDDTEALHADWLQVMVEQAQRKEVGAVGAWLIFPDGRTQHSGIILCPNMIARHISTAMTRDGLDRGSGLLTREVSAVTGACLMMRKEVFLSAGGFDATALPTSFNDVDLCLRLKEKGYRIIQCPRAKLIHHESATRRIDGSEEEYRRLMRQRWDEELRSERFWNPGLAQFDDLERGLAFHWQKLSECSEADLQQGIAA
jgi:glycosyltransferase involved in cell wall biosynthesis